MKCCCEIRATCSSSHHVIPHALPVKLVFIQEKLTKMNSIGSI